MQVYRKIMLIVVIVLVCLSTMATVTAQSNTAQSQWEQVVDAGLVQSLNGTTQTVGNTTVTLLDGYADARIIMIHFAVTGEQPPLVMHQHVFVTDDGRRITPVGEFNVELGHVVVFNNPGTTAGTLETFVVSATFGYDSQTGEYQEGDGSSFGPFNLGFSLTADTAVWGSGSGSQTAVGVTMELTDFFRTASGASATVCHNQPIHSVEGLTLESGTVVVSASGATMPFTNAAGQTCQTIAFVHNLDQLGTTATLRVERLKDLSFWQERPTVEETNERARRTAELMQEMGHDVELVLLGDGTYQLVGSAPEEAWRAVEEQINDYINGNWTFEVTLN